jgi:hypothetical protein
LSHFKQHSGHASADKIRGNGGRLPVTDCSDLRQSFSFGVIFWDKTAGVAAGRISVLARRIFGRKITAAI